MTAGPEFGPIGLDAFDTTLAAEQGSVMEVIGPSGETLRWPDGRPYTITLFGADSERVMNAARQISDRRTQAMMRTQKPAMASVIEKDQLDILVIATKSWDIPLADGTPAKSEPSEYRAAYQRYRWLLDQGNAFINARANFLKAAPTS